ncbi:MAG: DUF308 domain-containing protein [Pseudolysinimonas sp.]|uniref:DUF308 domain-containing protein n=1 Tax=Pseudolysinimonas sp. TaxID=2680009 RepID=UPI003265EDC1
MVAAWIPQLSRGILALALGLVITLTLEHSPAFGLLTFGVFAALTGAVLVVGTLRGAYAGRMSAAFVAQGAISVVAGVVSLGLAPTGTTVTFAVLVGVWAVVAGMLETVSGIFSRGRLLIARDWIIAGVLTAVLGAVALLVPPDFVQPFSGQKGVSGTLTASVILIGIVGAWAILVGVLQTISAVTLRTARVSRTATS